MNQIYKEYQANHIQSFPEAENIDEIAENLDELENAGYIITYNDYSFELTPAFISFMENRLKNTIIEATDLIAKFIP